MKVLDLYLAAKGEKYMVLGLHGNVVYKLDGGCHVVTALESMRKQHSSGETTNHADGSRNVVSSFA